MSTTQPQGATQTITEQRDVVQVAQAAAGFSTLLAAVQAAGLVETLQGEGPFTLFAPTDAAFARLPASALEGLLHDKARLTEVLTYHVVPGRVRAEEAMQLSRAPTVSGKELQLRVQDGKLWVDGATVQTADVPARNGVIHVIDGVLMP